MRPYSELADDDLLRLSRLGEDDAFRELFRRRQSALYRYALQMSGSADVGEEVVQDTFMVLIDGPVHFDASRGTLAAWLFGVARHHVRRRLARERRFVAVESPNGNEAPAPDDLFEELARGHHLDVLRRAILALPEHYREPVVLCDLQEMPYEEAAGLLGCPVGTVRSRLHRARVLLARRLKGLVESHR